MLVVVDTGPLYAAVDADDTDHARCRAVLENAAYRLIIPVLVVAEAAYLVGTRLGPAVEARFLSALASMDVEAPSAGDWTRMAELVERYADFPLGAVDASIVALAERLDLDTLVTLDTRHFRAVRPKHRSSFRLLP